MYVSLASLGRNDEVHREEFSRVIFRIDKIFVIWGVWYGMLRDPRVLSSCLTENMFHNSSRLDGT